MAGGEGTMQLKIQGIAVSIALLLFFFFLTFAKRGLKKYAKIILMVKILNGIHTIFYLINVLQLKL